MSPPKDGSRRGSGGNGIVLRPLWLGVMGLLLALFVANHVEFYLYQRRAAAEPDDVGGVDVPVKTVTGDDGHLAVVVDEEKLDTREREWLRFSELLKWNRDPAGQTPPPDSIARLEGKRVVAAGFMVSGSDSGTTARFSLTASLHSSERGPGHENHGAGEHREETALRVEMDHEVDIVFRRPVVVSGVFEIDRNAGKEGPFRLRGDRLEQASRASRGPGRRGRGEELPGFDFFWLEELEYQEARGLAFGIPEGLLNLEGKKVRATGFVQNREVGPPRSFILGKSFWDDCCTGTPPTYFNSILIVPGESTPIPPPWVERGNFAGVLKLTRDPEKWSEWGVVRIEEAYEVPAIAFRSGPHLPMWIEAFAFAMALLLALRRSRNPGGDVRGSQGSPPVDPPPDAEDSI